MIRRLGELVKRDYYMYGNKAAVLGELSRDFNVPAGIALPTMYFDKLIHENNYPFSEHEYFGKNREICSFIRQSNFSSPQKRMLKNSLNIHSPRIIVRSSAICEDTKKYSMAGMFVSNEAKNETEDILVAIKECYCSLFSDKVLEYFDDNHLDFSLLKMGVIVQEYVKGTYSGVIFTSDTKNHDTNVIHIGFVEGGCRDYVEGGVESYHVKVDKNTKTLMEDDCTKDGEVQLSKNLISALVEVSLAIENKMGFYSDIEWTYDGNKIYVLQARPITAVRDRRASFEVEENEKDRSWYLVGSELQRPLFVNHYRIFIAASNKGLSQNFYGGRDTLMKCINGYVYFGERETNGQVEVQRDAAARLIAMTDRGLGIFEDYCLPRLLPIKNAMDDYFEKNGSCTDSDLAAFLKLALEYTQLAAISHWDAFYGETYIEKFHEYVNSLCGNMALEELYDLVYTKTLKTKERELLFDIADFLKSSQELLEILHSSDYPLIVYERLKLSEHWKDLISLIHTYLKTFGMGYAARDKFCHPSYSLWEKPQYVIDHAKKIIAQDKGRYKASLINLQEKKTIIRKRICDKIPKEQKAEFDLRLAAAEKTFSAIDNHHYYCEDNEWGYVKAALMLASQRLKKNGLIEEDDDIYYLYYDEICGLLEKTVSHIEINGRKSEYEENCRLLAPDMIVAKLNEEVPQNEKKQDPSPPTANMKILRGISSLNRTVHGTILIESVIPHDIADDCILVLPSCRVGDLFPILSKVKGLVVIAGSPFDHMGIITREMNIPVLYNVKEALSVLKTGDKVVLNGEGGILEIE